MEAEEFGLSKVIKENMIGFIFDKALSFASGIVGAIIAVAIPDTYEIITTQYEPISSYIKHYEFTCITIFLFTVAMWSVLLKFHRTSTIPYIMGFIAIFISWLLREDFIPYGEINQNVDTLDVQFYLYFFSILIIMEALFIHFLRLSWKVLIILRHIYR